MTAIFNHLWQSTAFAAIAWLLTLALRNNHARVRHGIWLAASLKFLIPISLLIALGSHIEWRTAPPTPAQASFNKFNVAMDEVSQPFTAPMPSLPTAPPAQSPLPAILSGIWLCGSIGIAVSWWVRWRRIRAVVRAGSPVQLDLPITAICSSTSIEPGVFGTFRPVLLLPEGIADRLTPTQLKAVIAHELCHVRHRDNLIAAIHMFIETVFWFHPLIWWIGKRMVEERERACDEEVLSALQEPRAYAEGILNICKLYAESPLVCVSGITGPDLRKRIEAIMANRVAFNLSTKRKLLLAAAAVLALAGPITIGLMNAPQIQAQPQAQSPRAKTYSFDAASVKPHAPGDRTTGFPSSLPGGRFVARGSLAVVVAYAYKLPFNRSQRLTGLPDWARTTDYDIEAKGAVPAELPPQARDDRTRSMVQTLLANRFKLAIRRETKEMPVYALVVGKGGPKLQRADVDEKDCPDALPTLDLADPACHSLVGGRGRGLHGRAASIADLVNHVENWTDRPLLDKTGIKGLFRIDTKGWLSIESGPPPAPGAKAEDGSDIADVPSLFQVFEQMGLRMESQRDRADVYVVDHIEKPTEN